MELNAWVHSGDDWLDFLIGYEDGFSVGGMAGDNPAHVHGLAPHFEMVDTLPGWNEVRT
jgi:hypothetical protein